VSPPARTSGSPLSGLEGDLLGLRRYRAVCIGIALSAAVPYLWALSDLWNGGVDLLRRNGNDHTPVYDEQARALMHGHLWVTPGSISIEAFVSHGRQYTYFGLFPSLLRIPVFLFTNSLDGRMTAPSIFAAWVTTAVFCSLLLWRLRTVLRSDHRDLGWPEAAAYGALLASILVGSVLVYLASVPNLYSEDLAWSVALGCASLFVLVGVVENPSAGRVLACGVVVLLTNLDRSTTGYAAVIATGLIAAWFAFGRGGQERRRWAFPVAVAALVPLLVGCAIDFAKFGQLFSFPASRQLLYQTYGLEHINSGQYFGLRYLPATLQAYIDPFTLHLSTVFPYVTLPDVPAHPVAHTALFLRGPTAGVPFSAPLLFFVGLLGVVTAFTPGRPGIYGALRILLITTVLTGGTVMIFGWIVERFVSDFMPLLILSSMIGMIELWRRIGPASPGTKAVALTGIGMLTMFGVVANLGFASTPNKAWTPTQLANLVQAQRTLSDITGHPLDDRIAVATLPPWPAAMGTLWVDGHCRALFYAIGAPPRPDHPLSAIAFWQEAAYWLPVERAPHTALCHMLLPRAGQKVRGGGSSTSRPESSPVRRARRRRVTAWRTRAHPRANTVARATNTPAVNAVGQ